MASLLGADRLALRAAVVALALSVPTAAHAFCRTTTVPLPPSYSPSRGCFTEGLPLYWKGACVGYSLNEAASSRVSLDDATRIIDASFATWSAVTCAGGDAVGIRASNTGPVQCAEVRYNPTGPNQNLVVFREDRWPYNDPNNTLGLTTITYNADTGEIFDADMEINATGGNLTITDAVPPNGFDLASVVTHEAGHFFGLAHATDSRATMFASYKPGTSALRSLTQDDVDGVCAIYPTSSIRSVDETVAPGGQLAAAACDPTPRHGFGTTCDANPPEDDGGCSVGGRASPSGLAFVLGAVAVTAVRRRRRAM